MSDAFARRRARVLEQLAPDGIMVLAAAPEILIGRDTHLRYVVDAELYYLTGYQEPDAALVLDPASETPFMMFVRDRDPERELWMGKRAGVEGARSGFGAQHALNIAELPQQLPKLLAKANTVYARPSARPDFDAVLQQLFAQGRSTRARTGRGPHILRDPGDILDEMRVIKDDEEIELIRTAARITAEAFAETLPRAKAGLGEWEIEAILEFGFRSRGASGPAFPTISATGGNATVLHYIESAARLQDGDLLLLDAGARYQMYCADITRTVPVSGKFNAQHRDLYDVVLAAHDAAIAAVAPGLPVEGIHGAAHQTLVDGLVQLGLLRPEQRDDDTALKAFYPHKTSHWLGLEVHDVGLYAREDEAMLLKPGMVLTIEPGLYLAEQAIGIRVEDDVLVTTNGNEVMTASLPARADAIEALLQ